MKWQSERTILVAMPITIISTLQTLVYYNRLAGSMQKWNGAQSKIEKIEM